MKLCAHLSRPVDADTVEVLLQAAVLEGVEVDNLVTLIPPDLPLVNIQRQASDWSKVIIKASDWLMHTMQSCYWPIIPVC